MFESSTVVVEASDVPLLRRILTAAGLSASGQFVSKAGWTSRAWVGRDQVVRLSSGPARDAYRHETVVLGLLAASEVPHARVIASGDGADGSWSVTERLPGQTLHDAWLAADARARQSIVESLGAVLQALHQVPVPSDLLPPWLAGALEGGTWPAYHPPVIRATLQQVDAALRAPDRDARLLADVAGWVEERLPLFSADRPVLVHGDLHGSNVMVDRGRVTGLIDFAESLAQPADCELDTLLRWCARPQEFPPTPGAGGLAAPDLAEIPGWLRAAYPELFSRPHLRQRLHLYDMWVELAIAAHHPGPEVRATARGRIARLLTGHDHLDAFESIG